MNSKHIFYVVSLLLSLHLHTVSMQNKACGCQAQAASGRAMTAQDSRACGCQAGASGRGQVDSRACGCQAASGRAMIAEERACGCQSASGRAEVRCSNDSCTCNPCLCTPEVCLPACAKVVVAARSIRKR